MGNVDIGKQNNAKRSGLDIPENARGAGDRARGLPLVHNPPNAGWHPGWITPSDYTLAFIYAEPQRQAVWMVSVGQSDTRD